VSAVACWPGPGAPERCMGGSTRSQQCYQRRGHPAEGGTGFSLAFFLVLYVAIVVFAPGSWSLFLVRNVFLVKGGSFESKQSRKDRKKGTVRGMWEMGSRGCGWGGALSVQKGGYVTRTSRAVTQPGTILAHWNLSAEFRWDREYSPSYERSTERSLSFLALTFSDFVTRLGGHVTGRARDLRRASLVPVLAPRSQSSPPRSSPPYPLRARPGPTSRLVLSTQHSRSCGGRSDGSRTSLVQDGSACCDPFPCRHQVA